MPVFLDVGEAVRTAAVRECAGLLGRPAVTGQTRSTRMRQPFDGHQPPAGLQSPPGLSQTCIKVGPMMHGGDGPSDRHRGVRQRQGLRGALDIAHRAGGAPGEEPGEPQHHRRGINSIDKSSEPGGTAGGGTWPTSDIGHRVARGEFADALGQVGVTPSTQRHAGSGEEPGRPGEARIAGVVIRDGRLRGRHTHTLTVEPGFKSSWFMPELMTIGEVARRAHIATSTIRYYERRGMLHADERQSGQRRYRIETLRRLVFIGMMQDIGLSLDEISGILNAATAAEWKSIAGQRLAALDEHIGQLQHARGLLAAALWCRFDHPATDCNVMGAEIDRRLEA